jgi:CubicO group peptidase (beta-lactamase class C family)
MLGRVASIVLCCAGACWGQVEADLVDSMDDAVQRYVSTNQFMGSVLVARGDALVFNRAYGSANLELGVPNATETRFRIGSLTKQFTAAAVLLLEERGKLNVQDRINQHIPNPPAAWDKITIFQLLTHTSGIPNYSDFPEYPKLKPFAIAPARLVALIAERPLDFAPGAGMKYSNSGYAVLGYLIEQVSGEPYQQFIGENLLTPLHMDDTGYDSSSAVIPRRAAGYVQGPMGLENAAFVHMTMLYSAAGLYSTTRDLLRWQRGLFGGKILSPESLRKMTTPYLGGYGFGVNGHKRVWHGGGLDGFTSDLVYYPEDQITVAVLSNAMGDAPAVIAGELEMMMHGEAAAKRREVPLSLEALRTYAGTYEISPGVNVYIRLESGQLTEEITGQRRVKIFAESETRFFTRTGDAVFDFIKDDHGEVSQVNVHRYSRDRTGMRTSDVVKERTEIQLPAQALSQYVGTYQLPGLVLNVSLEGDHLMGRVPGQPAFVIFAESADHFFLRVVDARIDFVRDGSDAVTQLVLHQGPRDERGPRVAK